MDTMETAVLIVHTFIAVILIVLVLVQRGKGADAGAAFGAGASGTVFGARGSSNFFSRTTAILATAFFASSLILAYMSSQHTDRPESLLENAPAVTPAEPSGDETTPAGQEETPAMPALPALPEEDDEPAGEQALPDLEPSEPADDADDDPVGNDEQP
jgi:preprotein translocase subunit SecG